MRTKTTTPWATLAVPVAALLLAGCGDRPEAFDARVDHPVTTVGLAGAVAVLDPVLSRVVMLTARSNHGIGLEAFDVGENVAATATSPDLERLFVLSSGVQPRRHPKDELPSLTVLGGTTNPSAIERYPLTDPLTGLAVDPLGRWITVFDSGGVVVNPNELILIDLSQGGAAPVTKTIRSFGGRPQRLTYTSELAVPSGPPRRFLLIETEQDVHLLDLAHLERDPVTIILPKTSTGAAARPAEVAFHDGDPDDATDAKIAIRLANDSNVVLLELGPPADPGKDFKINVNAADVNAQPTSIDFVMTDGGLRLAALVPSQRKAALIDPSTIVTDFIDLPGPYARLARVTEEVGATGGASDVALLWDATVEDGIAYWALGRTAGKPFRSVEASNIGMQVREVRDVPGAANQKRKLLVNASATEFYVLDLENRTAFPMLTEAANFDVGVAPDGGRAWAVRTGTRRFASVDLDTLHPRSLEIERDIIAVHDIEGRDGGRAAVAVHSSGTVGVTVLDALEPDTADTTFHTGILLGGLR